MVYCSRGADSILVGETSQASITYGKVINIVPPIVSGGDLRDDRLNLAIGSTI